LKKLVVLGLFLVIALCVAMTGCQTQAEKVSYNLSLEADNFNVIRQLTVINCIQGDVLFQMTGKISIEVDEPNNQLEIVVEDEHSNYQKHFVGLSDNVTYTVEQLDVKNVDNYKFNLNFNPNMWLPVTVETID